MVAFQHDGHQMEERLFFWTHVQQELCAAYCRITVNNRGKSFKASNVRFCLGPKNEKIMLNKIKWSASLKPTDSCSWLIGSFPLHSFHTLCRSDCLSFSNSLMETYAPFVTRVLGLKRDQVSGLAECFSHECRFSSLPPNSYCGLQEEGEGKADCCTEPNYRLIWFYTVTRKRTYRKQTKKSTSICMFTILV